MTTQREAKTVIKSLIGLRSNFIQRLSCVNPMFDQQLTDQHDSATQHQLNV